MPVLARLQSEYQAEGLKVLGVNIWSSAFPLTEWERFMGEFASEDFAREAAVQDVASAAIEDYQLNYLGTEVLVDPEGQVAWRSDNPSSYTRLKEAVATVLQ